MEKNTLHYDAFISYRHGSLDQKIAERLHKRLENYTLPKTLAKKIGRSKLNRVFRDNAELSVSAELSEVIDQALRNSDYLIVICSPRLPESEWCMKEIETFIELRDRKHILLVLIDGEPENSFPEIMCYEDVVGMDETGKEVITRKKREPLAADCRANTPVELHNALNSTVLKLCAAIFGLNYDDLKQRHHEEQIRRRFLAISAIIVILLLIIIQSAYFMVRLGRQNLIIQDRLADTIASSSAELLQKGRRMDAIYAAKSVLPKIETRNFNANAYRALVDATGIYSTPDRYIANKTLRLPSPLYGVVVSPDGQYIAGSDYANQGISYLINSEDGSIINTFENEGGYAFSFDRKKGVFLYDDKNVKYYRFSDETLTDVMEGRLYFFTNQNYDANLVLGEETISGVKNGKIVFTLDFDTILSQVNAGKTTSEMLMECRNCITINLSEDGAYAVALFNNPASDGEFAVISCIDTATGEIVYSMYTKNTLHDACFDGIYLYVLEDSNDSAYYEKINVKKNKVTRSMFFEGEFFDTFEHIGGYIVSRGQGRIIVLNEDLVTVGTLGLDNNSVSFFSMDGTPAFFTGNADLYIWLSDNRTFREIHDFTRKDFDFYECLYRNGKVYLHGGETDYITIYEQIESPYIRFLSDSSASPEMETSMDIISGDELEAIYEQIHPGEKMPSTFDILVSSDKKYIAMQDNDKKVEIYDAETSECIYSTYTIEKSINFFYYVPADDCYCLGNYSGVCIFSPEFDFISEIGDINVMGVSSETGRMVFCGVNSDYYELTIASYKEVMAKADEMLGDYVPEQKILERYGLE